MCVCVCQLSVGRSWWSVGRVCKAKKFVLFKKLTFPRDFSPIAPRARRRRREYAKGAHESEPQSDCVQNMLHSTSTSSVYCTCYIRSAIVVVVVVVHVRMQKLSQPAPSTAQQSTIYIYYTQTAAPTAAVTAAAQWLACKTGRPKNATANNQFQLNSEQRTHHSPTLQPTRDGRQ